MVKFLKISDLLKHRNTRIFGVEGLLARKYAILVRLFVKEIQMWSENTLDNESSHSTFLIPPFILFLHNLGAVVGIAAQDIDSCG